MSNPTKCEMCMCASPTHKNCERCEGCRGPEPCWNCCDCGKDDTTAVAAGEEDE